MANVLRQAMPLLHDALDQFLSDPIVYQRATGGASFETKASPAEIAGDEAVTQGNNLRLFMSLLQCGGVAPVQNDLVTKAGQVYRVADVVADDFDGFTLSLRKK
jgi:hypothetical protein